MGLVDTLIETYISPEIDKHFTVKRYEETVDSSIETVAGIINRHIPKVLWGQTASLQEAIVSAFYPIRWLMTSECVYTFAKNQTVLAGEQKIKQDLPILINQFIRWTYHEILPIIAAIAILKIGSYIEAPDLKFSINHPIISVISFYVYRTNFLLYGILLSKLVRLIYSTALFALGYTLWDKQFFYNAIGENITNAIWPMIRDIKILNVRMTEK